MTGGLGSHRPPDGNERIGRLQRQAYGRDSTPEQRAEALRELSALSTEPGSSRVPDTHGAEAPNAHTLGSRPPIAGDATPKLNEGPTGESAPEGPSGAPVVRRERRVWLAVVAAAVGVAVVAAGVIAGVQLAAARPTDPSSLFASPQGEEDRRIPDWLDAVVTTAAADAEDTELRERVLASMRVVEHDDLRAFVFRDEASGTSCIAAKKAIDCASPGVFDLEGVHLTVVPVGEPWTRYSYSFDRDGFVAAAHGLTTPKDVVPVGGSLWPSLIERCAQEGGFSIAATPQGLIIPAPIGEESRLEYSLTVSDCMLRYPMQGAYAEGPTE